MTFLDNLLMIIHSWSKNLSKVHEIRPILFQIFWLNFSPKSIWVHQVPPTHKWAKIAEKSFKMGLFGTQISRDWDSRFILGLKIQHMYSAVNDHEHAGYKPKFIGTIK